MFVRNITISDRVIAGAFDCELAEMATDEWNLSDPVNSDEWEAHKDNYDRICKEIAKRNSKHGRKARWY